MFIPRPTALLPRKFLRKTCEGVLYRLMPDASRSTPAPW